MKIEKEALAVRAGGVYTMSVPVRNDLNRAAFACEVVKNACESSDGAYLFSPDIMKLRGLNSVLHCAVDAETGELLANCFTYAVGASQYLSTMYAS